MSNTTPAQSAGPLTLLQAAEVARWYDEFTPEIRHYATNVLLRCYEDAPDVDDLLHDVFVRLIRHVAEIITLDDKHRRNYVYQTARWIAADRYRKRYGKSAMARAGQGGQLGAAVPLSAVASSAMEPLTASHDWQAHMQPEQTTAARMSLRAVWEATPPKYRDVLLLLAAGVSPADMARRLGLTENAVNMRVYRLRAVLREAGERIV